MAPIAWSDVVAVSSVLSAVDPLQQAELLAVVNGEMNTFLFGGEDAARTKLARIYFAAHFASLPGAGASAAAGPVVSESRGGLSRAYQAIGGGGGSGSDNWDDTQWGRRYKTLLSTSRGGWPRVAGQ